VQRNIWLKAISLCILWLATNSTQAFAQGNTGRLEGTVLDPTGAVVPNAAVSLKNDGTGQTYTATTDATSGNFGISALPVGSYELSVQVPGFKTYQQHVSIDPGVVANAKISLDTGEVTQTVTVSGDAAVVESATSEIGATMEARQVTDLPLNGRDFTQVALLSPGVTRGIATSPATGSGGNAETFRYGGVGGAALAVNGLRPEANNFLLDGMDNNESLVNTIVFFPNAEAIQEFRVDTSVAPAEFGRAGGAIVNTAIKAGTNEIHGTLFEFLRNSEVDARQTFASSKTLFQRNQFGATIGAPILKNKFFIFGDYQGLRQNQPLEPGFVTVPTQAMRSGDFSALLNPSTASLPGGTPVQLINVQTGLPYANNQITNINAVGQAYLNAFPLPNYGPAGAVEHNYITHEFQTQTFDDFDVRGDYIISDKQQLYNRFSFGRDLSATSSEFANLPAGFGTGTNFNEPRGDVLSHTYTLSATLVNQIWLGWQRSFLGYNPPLGNVPVSANLGIPNANRSPLLGGGALIGGYGSQLEYTGDYGTYSVPENTYEIKDGLTKMFGAHNLKFGLDIIYRQVNYFRPEAGKGYFDLFGNGIGPGSTGWESADLLAGFVNNYQIGAQSGFYGTRSWEDGFFAQDDWKVNSRLTLNLGLRYDLLTWPTEQFNRQSDFNLGTGTVLIAGQNGVSSSIVKNDHNNFAPRVGFAYQLTNDGKTVVRGGFGTFYFIDRGGISNQLGQNAPFAGVSQYNYSDGYRITISGAAPLNSNNPLAGVASAMPPATLVGFNPANPVNQSFAVWPTNNRTPYVNEYNLQIQREVAKDTVLSVSYVGDIGRKLALYYNANSQFFNAPLGARPYPTVGSLTVMQDIGNSNYNSLQVQFQKRFSHGFQFISSFTWSKDMDDGDGAFDGSQPQNIYNLHSEWARASIDQPVVFHADTLWELPFGRGESHGKNWARPVDAILGGWHLNTIWTLQSGTPINFSANGNERPNVTGKLGVIGDTNAWFDTNIFVNPPTLGNTGVYIAPGNLGRNPILGPGQLSVDVGLFKDFSLTERLKLQFRAQAYNIGNRAQFSQPDTGIFDSNFGRITSTLLDTERQIEFAARVTF
jgi:hypothetical protein